MTLDSRNPTKSRIRIWEMTCYLVTWPMKGGMVGGGFSSFLFATWLMVDLFGVKLSANRNFWFVKTWRSSHPKQTCWKINRMDLANVSLTCSSRIYKMIFQHLHPTFTMVVVISSHLSISSDDEKGNMHRCMHYVNDQPFFELNVRGFMLGYIRYLHLGPKQKLPPHP